MTFCDHQFRRLCHSRDLLAEIDHSPAVRDVARAVGMSQFHFIRQFQALFGFTPHQFRLQRRLDRARLLLATRELPVTTVSLEAGFQTLGRFNELFRRETGETPTAFQRRARTLVTVPDLPPPALFPGCLNLLACLPPGAFRNFREAPPTIAR